MGPQSCLGLKALRNLADHVEPEALMTATTIHIGICRTPKQVIVQPIAKTYINQNKS